MKKVIIVSALSLLSFGVFAQAKKAVAPKKETKKEAVAKPAKVDKSKDNVDDRMKGPNGEKIMIGDKGGRYYINKSGKKTYVEYKGNKKSAKK